MAQHRPVVLDAGVRKQLPTADSLNLGSYAAAGALSGAQVAPLLQSGVWAGMTLSALATFVLASLASARTPVLVATTGNITLSGEQTIDGVLTSASRVLVRSQTAPAQNGCYVSAAGAWSRATDMDAWAEVPGAIIVVQQGSTLADTVWICTSDEGGTLGTTAVVFAQMWGASLYQPAHAKLSAIVAATWAADKLLYLSGANAVSVADLTSFARTLLAAANNSAARSTLGLVIGTDVQAYHANLAAFAGLSLIADRLPYANGAGTLALATLTSFARTLLDDADAATARATLVIDGKQELWIPAAAFNPEVTNGAARGYTSLATNLQIQDSLDFDQTTQEFANVLIKLPKRWNLSTLTFIPHWTAAAGSGGVVWAVQAAVISNDDPANPSWGTEQTSTDTLLATGDEHAGPESSAITAGGSPAAGDLLWLRIKRNVADGSDTLTGDAQLLGISLYFTSNAGNDA